MRPMLCKIPAKNAKSRRFRQKCAEARKNQRMFGLCRGTHTKRAGLTQDRGNVQKMMLMLCKIPAKNAKSGEFAQNARNVRKMSWMFGLCRGIFINELDLRKIAEMFKG